ncbi:MAG: two-component system response regulator [Deltaproteobacteria bacterium HGW-Deltaproteobacteria-6]|jgi:CheY-like chemotaxis protein|nr:MAG: two-component system response regulator [Deltaproteobacteria bacterium HGW-Deltaproteobacteria-6]
MDNVDIVIVEDNHHDIEMILDAFRELEIKADTLIFSDGTEAVKNFFGVGGRFFSEKCKLPRLILLDLKLPKINGMEVLKLLKTDERTRSIPVVVFTTSNEQRDRMESYKLGANSYLVKPLDADQFVNHIKQIINYWISLNENGY